MKKGLALAALLALSTQYACATSGNDAARAGTGSGAKAAEFTVPLTNGETFRLADHLGKSVIVVDFWTTFCQPCVGSLMHLETMYKKHKGNGFLVFGVSMDPPETSGQVVPFIRSHNLTFPMAHDADSKITELYNKKSSAPYSVLIGRDGRILKIRESYQPGDEASIDADIEGALSVK